MKTRFCPSPTGHMHLGNLRTALFNALAARSEPSGVFLLRVEDTDRERHQDPFVAAMFDDLRWLGLHWDEGPEAAGDHGPYHQSQRLEQYQAYYDTLLAQGQAYPCFCSEQTLALSRKLQLSSGQAPKYNGGCWQLSAADVAERQAQQQPFVLRFRMPTDEVVQFTDLVRGELRFPCQDMGDFIIRRSTGMPSFMFANAVDDALMGVTHALRGEDHLTNTPRQLLIQRALGLPQPYYAHISMIKGDDGQPLSKRNGSMSINTLRQRGYLPGAILNYLARLGHHYTHSDYLSLAGLAQQFQFQSLVKAAAKFDATQLDVWQSKAMQRLANADLWHLISDQIKDMVPTTQRDQFIEAVKPNVLFAQEAEGWAQILFQPLPDVSADQRRLLASTPADFFQLVQQGLQTFGCDYDQLCSLLQQQLDLRGKALFLPLRLVFTGRSKGPEMRHLLPLIGPQRALQRVSYWLQA